MKTRVKLSFHLILTLAAMLMMAQTATADDVTVTWPMDGTGNSADTRYDSESKKAIVLSKYVWSNSSRTHKTYIQNVGGNIELGKYNVEISFPDIKGTITSITLNNVSFNDQDGGKLCLYAGTDMDNLLRTGDNQNYYQSMAQGSANRNLSYTGSVVATESVPMKLMFRHAQGTSSSNLNLFDFINGSIVVTYTPEAQQDTGHRFSYSISTDGASLTAECTANHTCDIPNRKATVTLGIEDMSLEEFYRNPYKFDISEFKRLTGLEPACSVITYTNKTTGESSTGKLDEGSYTASVTITIDETSYTLNKDFNLLEGFKVNNSYSQLSVSPRTALEGDEVTITYTQQMDENLEGLTLTGATSGNNIAYTQSGNTYTFTMPAEDVNLNATITYPLNENDFTQSGDTYTIKTADGWNYFCRRMEVDDNLNGFSGKTVVLGDNITVTTSMAGSGKYPFKGTFDGDGHTLTFNHTASAPCSAPFQNTNGATIRNLHATGQIEGGIWNYIGGLVGSANGNLTIENCRVSTLISSTVSGTAFNGGFVGYLSSQYNQCYITGCVFDGLIYNPNYSGTTYGCGGFVGCFSQYGYAILEDCLFIHGQYDNNGGKHELWWGNENDKNSTFLHRTNNQGSGKLTNCFYVGTRGLKQGSPAVESATAPTNFAHFGTPTDHRFLKVYGHTMVFDGKYYTPTYGDLVETYSYSGVKSYNIEYDDAPLGIPDIASPLWTESLRYNRSFTAGKPVTIMLPFNFKRDRITLAGSNENPSGKFYEFKGIEENQDHKWVAVMIEAGETLSNEVVENTLQANHPYLYVPGESTEHWAMYVSGGFSIFTEGNEGGEKQTEYDGSKESYSWNKWNFKGTYQPRYWSDSENPEEIGKVYGFAGASKEVDGKLVEAGEFVRAKLGAKIRPTSCYLMWAGSEPSNARALTRSAAATEELPQSITVKLISASGETTAIGTLDTKTGEMTFDSEAWYTLDGVRLSGKPSSKGIYINNGKKVVIK